MTLYCIVPRGWHNPDQTLVFGPEGADLKALETEYVDHGVPQYGGVDRFVDWLEDHKGWKRALPNTYTSENFRT